VSRTRAWLIQAGFRDAIGRDGRERQARPLRASPPARAVRRPASSVGRSD
jgi:hypothetical protein